MFPLVYRAFSGSEIGDIKVLTAGEFGGNREILNVLTFDFDPTLAVFGGGVRNNIAAGLEAEAVGVVVEQLHIGCGLFGDCCAGKK